MTNTQYLFTFTRFACGCAYRTSTDTPVFCPEHHDEPHRGAIMEQGTIYTPTPDIPDVPGLVISQHWEHLPILLRNSSSNSLHTTTYVLDAKGNEWKEKEEGQVGLCAACFVEKGNDYFETGIAMCECGQEQCSYRWCGSLTGLHAYWRPHVQGKSKDISGIPDEDIFNYGTYEDQNVETNDALEAERDDLTAQIEKLMRDMETARHQAGGDQPAEQHQSIYLIPWLDEEYSLANQPEQELNLPQRQLARSDLFKKIARLHIIGALPPIQPLAD